MRTKELLSIVMIAIMCVCSFNIPATANDEITVLLDGEKVYFDVPPQLSNGRTIVPLRKVCEELGAHVFWLDGLQAITVEKRDIIINLWIGKNDLSFTDYSSENAIHDRIDMGAPAQLVDGRTLVPIRAIAESLGAKVDWDEATKTVLITSKEKIEADQQIYEPLKLYVNDFELVDSPAMLSTDGENRVYIPVVAVLESMGSTVTMKEVSPDAIKAEILSYDGITGNVWDDIDLWQLFTKHMCFDFNGRDFLCKTGYSLGYPYENALLSESKYKYSTNTGDLIEITFKILPDGELYTFNSYVSNFFENLQCTVDIDLEEKIIKITQPSSPTSEEEVHSLDEFKFITKGMSMDDVKEKIGDTAFSINKHTNKYLLEDGYELIINENISDEISAINLEKYSVFGNRNIGFAIFNEDGSLKIENGEICFE